MSFRPKKHTMPEESSTMTCVDQFGALGFSTDLSITMCRVPTIATALSHDDSHNQFLQGPISVPECTRALQRMHMGVDTKMGMNKHPYVTSLHNLSQIVHTSDHKTVSLKKRDSSRAQTTSVEYCTCDQPVLL
jgi:hypothetical protein